MNLNDFGIPEIEHTYNDIGDRYLSKRLKDHFVETVFYVLSARGSKLDIFSAFLCLSVINFLCSYYGLYLTRYIEFLLHIRFQNFRN